MGGVWGGVVCWGGGLVRWGRGEGGGGVGGGWYAMYGCVIVEGKGLFIKSAPHININVTGMPSCPSTNIFVTPDR